MEIPEKERETERSSPEGRGSIDGRVGESGLVGVVLNLAQVSGSREQARARPEELH